MVLHYLPVSHKKDARLKWVKFMIGCVLFVIKNQQHDCIRKVLSILIPKESTNTLQEYTIHIRPNKNKCVSGNGSKKFR